MYSASHRLNHDFQLKHFMANSCHTADAAYALLYAQMIDMESKIAHGKGQAKRREITRLKYEAILADDASDQIAKLEAEAELLELESSQYVFDMNIEGAHKELQAIKSLMAELEPQRKYAHLPILEANEACQREELAGEMKRRAENYLLSQGSIPADHLETMRNHPDFTEVILPHIVKITQTLRNSNGDMAKAFASVQKPLLLGTK